MKREDLFLAIGEVEESRLARCENLSASNVTALEDGIMKTNTKKRRPLRLMLIAAVMVAMIAAIALVSAAPEPQLNPYENSKAMLEAAFGINGYPGEEGKVYQPDDWAVNMQYIPSYQREELDMALAEKLVAPCVYEVNGIVTGNGYTVTVEAAVYDPVTDVGLLYYSIENAAGVTGYELQNNGEIWWPEGGPVSLNYPSETYIDTARTTDTKLCVVKYFIYGQKLQNSMRGKALCVNIRGTETVLEVPVSGRSGMKTAVFGNGAVRLSPIGVVLDGRMMDMLTGRELLIGSLVIRYADGSEYVVEAPATEADGPSTMNYAYGFTVEEGTLTFALNRIVDVEQVVSVAVDGIEFPVDQN